MSTDAFEPGDDDEDSPLPRGLGLSCAYAPSPQALGDGTAQPVHPVATVQDRIKQLEDLVVDLMQKTSASNAPPLASSNPSPSANTPLAINLASPRVSPSATLVADDTHRVNSPDSDHGSLRLTKSGASYVHGTHWAAVLDGIAELKDHFDRDDESHRYQGRNIGVDTASPYYGQAGVAYQEFWADSSETPIIWIGLLFSIICLATLFEQFQQGPQDQVPGMPSKSELQDMVSNFRLRIVQCLILGDYTKGGVYVLETLLLYMAVELFLRKDAEIGIWILLGIIVQLSMHMGYHRDPKNLRGISPFDGEMRKRVWATVLEVQLGISMQMGLPRLIAQWQTNTTEPSNLQDNDFNKDTVSMPASRPETDLTPMVFRIVKARMMTAIGYIWDFAADTRACSHEETEHMEKNLQEARASIPECLQWQSMTDCIMDAPHVIMQKICLEIMFYRAKLVLHRKYLHLSQSNADYRQSQTACLSAALKLLAYQQMLEEETQPFCQLHHERWKVSSLVNHDFLLATSVLCLYLKQSAGDANAQAESPTAHDIRTALNQAYDIWLQSSDTSREAWKAAKALSIVLSQPGPGNVRHDEQLLSSSHAQDDYFEQFSLQFPLLDGSVLMDWPFANNNAMYTY
ncbi:fungal specific transcription factor domain protein [Cordyceps militaris CM01]|uniref:Fungal specific transcription factor domain protein n=1 Tax=Cordyceps militaris (strain CM01) TaxID=983644 RepID=G3J7Q5_CORMM|nr:fungal specific transcription factor domain protein [Cordyceps militaris CM01]EGX95521.1 fungal specific transcription factor domain protein [Cordyceps militaris CM01]